MHALFELVERAAHDTLHRRQRHALALRDVLVGKAVEKGGADRAWSVASGRLIGVRFSYFPKYQHSGKEKHQYGQDPDAWVTGTERNESH